MPRSPPSISAALPVRARLTRFTRVPTAVITATPSTKAANTVSRAPASASRRSARHAWRSRFMLPLRARPAAGGRHRCGGCTGSAGPAAGRG
ncbi:hypothetical protein G6F24_014749 [Rhizopus arrhizus]|nr:hypothetical protein G6F24_014749 [Rhizopus arrhizus]